MGRVESRVQSGRVAIEEQMLAPTPPLFQSILLHVLYFVLTRNVTDESSFYKKIIINECHELSTC